MSLANAVEAIDVELRKSVGRAFAVDCRRFELWDVNGPTSELRERVATGDLPTEVLVLMRVALDLFDGSGGNLTFAEVAALLANPTGANTLFFLAEFLGSALTSMPESLQNWVDQYQEEFANNAKH